MESHFILALELENLQSELLIQDANQNIQLIQNNKQGK
jgi:hypothetical protein